MRTGHRRQSETERLKPVGGHRRVTSHLLSHLCDPCAIGWWPKLHSMTTSPDEVSNPREIWFYFAVLAAIFVAAVLFSSLAANPGPGVLGTIRGTVVPCTPVVHPEMPPWSETVALIRDGEQFTSQTVTNFDPNFTFHERPGDYVVTVPRGPYSDVSVTIKRTDVHVVNFDLHCE